MPVEGTGAGVERDGGEKGEEESMAAATSSVRGGGAQAGQNLRPNLLHVCLCLAFAVRRKVQC
jgi:hypothetical protein